MVILKEEQYYKSSGAHYGLYLFFRKEMIVMSDEELMLVLIREKLTSLKRDVSDLREQHYENISNKRWNSSEEQIDDINKSNILLRYLTEVERLIEEGELLDILFRDEPYEKVVYCDDEKITT